MTDLITFLVPVTVVGAIMGILGVLIKQSLRRAVLKAFEKDASKKQR